MRASPSYGVTAMTCPNQFTRLWEKIACVAFLSVLLLQIPALAQSSEAEHQSHHPGAAPAADSNAPTSGASSPSGSQDKSAPQSNAQPPAAPGNAATKPGMMDGMAKMMEGMMGEGARKEIYPSLMALPSLSPQQRSDVERLAEERIHDGTELLQAAQGRLLHAIEAGDHDAAERALQQARDATAQVDSGVAAHRLIREGAPPQQVASQWFMRTMGLSPANPGTHGIFGLTWFHYSLMAFLLVVAASMVAIYFYRSQRAAALAEKLAQGGAGQQNDNRSAATNMGGKATQPSGASVATLEQSASATVMPLPGQPQSNVDMLPSRANSWTGPLMVARIFQETAQVKTFRLVDPDGGKLPFNYLPGQFLTFTVTPRGQKVKRSYTIASSPTRRDFCEVTVRYEQHGLVSGYLHEHVHEGELLQVTAPSGKFTFAGQDASSIVLIAGGVGVTPMMSVIRYLTDRSWPGDIYLIYGCKADDDVIYREEIEYLQKRYANLHVSLVADQVDPARWPYATGRITKELLSGAVPNIEARHVHLCGPKPMMDAVKEMLTELGVPAEQVETEVFIGKERPAAPVPPLTLEGAVSAPVSGTTAATPAASATVTFARSGKTALLPLSKTILEASEDVGVNIEYSCRAGTCGICKVKLLQGEVAMDVDDALEPADKEQNVILACQATAKANVVVDA